MVSVGDRARASRVLRDSGFSVLAISELFSVEDKTVYAWLKMKAADDTDRVSVAADLDQRLASAEDRDDTFVTLARALAQKLDKLIASDKGIDAATIPPLTKEFTSLVTRILGPSSDDKQWLVSVFAPVGHATDTGA